MDEKEFIIIKAALEEWQDEVDEWVQGHHGDDEEWNPPDEESDAYFHPSGKDEPLVKILEPLADQLVASEFKVKAKILSPFTILKVEFYLDDKLVSTKTSIPYEETYKVSSLSQGKHSVKVVGYDAAGNAGSTDRKIYINSVS